MVVYVGPSGLIKGRLSGLRKGLLKGSWDLVTRVIKKVTIHIITYTPLKLLITILTKSHDPPSKDPGVSLGPESPEASPWGLLGGTQKS